MDNFDMELARLRDEVSRSEQLRRRLGSMRSQRETLAAREAELRAARIEEAEDVEGLEGRSLARFIYSLTGSLEERLRQFEQAVRTVYASTMDPSALEYRAQRGL